MKKNKESNKESGNFIVFIAISSLVLILTMGMTITNNYRFDLVVH
ncbi:hypothetical protein DEU40_101344 [Chryseobacterium sp. AG844]|nr:hypothetical protein DEU40_101344 [Chryseobacterium sp. AG844]